MSTKEQRTLWQRRYLARHPEKAKELRAREMERFKERYYSDDEYKKRVKANAKAWSERNKELVKARRRSDAYKATNRRYAARPHIKLARRDAWLRSHYGITLIEYEEMCAKQNGRCAICKQVQEHPDRWKSPYRRLRVDHDHVTGKVRGLLCHHCNAGIGHLKDDPDVLRAAVRYLDTARDSDCKQRKPNGKDRAKPTHIQTSLFF